MNIKRLVNLTFIATILTFSAASAQQISVPVDELLITNTVKLTLPVPADDGTEAVTELLNLKTGNISEWQPKSGTLTEGTGFTWKAVSGDDGEYDISSGSGTGTMYAAFYIKTDGYAKVKIAAESCFPFALYIDGNESGKNTSVSFDECEPSEVKKETGLETGTHTVILRIVTDERIDTDNIKLSVMFDEKYKERVRTTVSPVRTTTVDRLLYDPKIRSVDISPDGKYAAVSLRQYNKETEKSESWYVLYNAVTGKQLAELNGSFDLSGFNWTPMENKYSYLEKGKNGSKIWLRDITKGTGRVIAELPEDASGYRWSPYGSYIIYYITDKPENDETGLKKMEGPQDRWPGYRNNTQIYSYTLSTGIHKQLTDFDNSVYVRAFNSDGSRMIIAGTEYDFTRRPFNYSVYYELDPVNAQLDSLFTLYWGGGVEYSPDGNKLLIEGGPSTFGDIGVTVPDDMIPNEYDTQVYLYDKSTGKVESITRKFNPRVLNVKWIDDNTVYMMVTDRYFQTVYKYDMSTGTYTRLDLPLTVLSNFDISRDGSRAVFFGSGANTAPRAYLYDAASGKSTLILNPNEETYKNIELGKVEEWDFVNERGTNIDGFVYLPPDFDPSEKYPCIVYYYGGTSPVEESFEGRYPKNIWAANGYVVYVLEPSGATGYGQEFSALHVNEWGNIVAEEIIDGTKKFLESHSYVDPARVGCIGASYGGFMTMNILTKTDIFAGAIAHAGISSIASYWGEGYWGFLYSAVATAEKYPWNAEDFYVKSSPLYDADKVTTPLLMLHGDADVNVPPGESRQFFAALKILNKDVELIEVADQDHHILDPAKRELWTKTIIAWFDFKLKGEPEWWNALYNE